MTLRGRILLLIAVSCGRGGLWRRVGYARAAEICESASDRPTRRDADSVADGHLR